MTGASPTCKRIRVRIDTNAEADATKVQRLDLKGANRIGL